MTESSNDFLYAQSNLLKYFRETIEPYLLGDLRRLKEIEPNLNGEQACAIPQLMLILSSMDHLGQLMSSLSRDSSGIGVFIKKYCKDLKPVAKILIKLFRHGVMHHFFPKVLGINKSVEYGVSLFIDDGNSYRSLDLSYLTNIFEKGVHQLLCDIESSIDKSIQNLVIRMDENLRVLINSDEQESLEFIALIEKHTQETTGLTFPPTPTPQYPGTTTTQQPLNH